MFHIVQRTIVFSLATLLPIQAYAASSNDEKTLQPLALNGAIAPDARLVALVGNAAVTRSKGVAAFTHPSMAQYCIQPVAAIKVATLVPSVSVDWSTSSGNGLLAFYRSSGSGCPTNNISVVTYAFLGGADPVLSDAVGFTVAIP